MRQKLFWGVFNKKFIRQNYGFGKKSEVLPKKLIFKGQNYFWGVFNKKFIRQNYGFGKKSEVPPKKLIF